MTINELEIVAKCAAAAFQRLLAAVPLGRRPQVGEDAMQVRALMERLLKVAAWALALRDEAITLTPADDALWAQLDAILDAPVQTGGLLYPRREALTPAQAEPSQVKEQREVCQVGLKRPVTFEEFVRDHPAVERIMLRVNTLDEDGAARPNVAQVYAPEGDNPLLCVPQPEGMDLVSSIILAVLRRRAERKSAAAAPGPDPKPGA